MILKVFCVMAICLLLFREWLIRRLSEAPRRRRWRERSLESHDHRDVGLGV